MTGEKSLVDQVRNQHAMLSSGCLTQPWAVTRAWLGALFLSLTLGRADYQKSTSGAGILCANAMHQGSQSKREAACCWKINEECWLGGQQRRRVCLRAGQGRRRRRPGQGWRRLQPGQGHCCGDGAAPAWKYCLMISSEGYVYGAVGPAC